MLRQTRAKWLASATAVLVVLMAGAFAALRNVAAPPGAEQSAGAAKTAPQDTGRRAFERLNCAMCHSIGGAGNPALPLDGIGKRLARTELRAWTTGTGVARERLPASVVRRKAPASDDPDLDALLDYLERSK
jgi:cytochrome c